jgi:hypothetical protein
VAGTVYREIRPSDRFPDVESNVFWIAHVPRVAEHVGGKVGTSGQVRIVRRRCDRQAERDGTVYQRGGCNYCEQETPVATQLNLIGRNILVWKPELGSSSNLGGSTRCRHANRALRESNQPFILLLNHPRERPRKEPFTWPK